VLQGYAGQHPLEKKAQNWMPLASFPGQARRLLKTWSLDDCRLLPAMPFGGAGRCQAIQKEMNMPFTPPFRDALAPGDLVYGLSGPRSRWIDLMRADETQYCTIDSYGGSSSNRRFLNMVGIRPPNQQDFSLFLKNHPRYGVIFDIDRGMHGEHIDHNRKKCKAGLGWIASQQKMGFAVHFILDEIDMSEVIEKRPNANCGVGVRSVTGSELRWVYRNRHVPAVRNCVQFWRNNQPVVPPWMFSSSPSRKIDWSAYVPKGEQRASLLSRIFCLA
jgi:hypothetical protein